MKNLNITHHAIKRARKRLSWSKKAVTRMAMKAFNEGVVIPTNELKQTLMMLHGIVFVFKQRSLITVYNCNNNKNHGLNAVVNYHNS